jgi:hypothetical protein
MSDFIVGAAYNRAWEKGREQGHREMRAEIERLVGIVAVRNDEGGLLRAEVERLRSLCESLAQDNERLIRALEGK